MAEENLALEGICLGYIRLDRPGDDLVECIECGQDCQSVYLAVMVTGDGLLLYGPLCEACADSD